MKRMLGTTVAGLLAAGTAVGAGPTGTAAAAAGAGGTECRLVQLKAPEGSPWGTVVEIETVDGKPLYYGTVDRFDKQGDLVTRAVVWRGLRAKPRVVGPRGWPVTGAYDLTRTGLVNGFAEDPEAGTGRNWVQDLRTGRLRWYRGTLAGKPADHSWVRRVNDRGAAVGTVTQDGGETTTAVGYRSRSVRPFRLPAPRRAAWSEASGIDDRGRRVGFWAEWKELWGEEVPLFRPTLWDRKGRRTTLAVPGLDAAPRVVNNRGQVAGDGWMGDANGHPEAVYWPSYDRARALGLLPGGGSSSVFGLDRGGRAVGGGDRYDPSSPHAFPGDGTVAHSWFWTPALGEGRVRVLPSLYSVRTGETDWREFHATHVAHASHAASDQIGAGTHVGFDSDGFPIGAPTVFVNASRCGTTVDTTHEAFWERRGERGRAAVATLPSPAERRAAVARLGAPRR